MVSGADPRDVAIARVRGVAEELAAYDCTVRPTPQGIDVPDDYEEGLHRAALMIRVALDGPVSKPDEALAKAWDEGWCSGASNVFATNGGRSLPQGNPYRTSSTGAERARAGMCSTCGGDLVQAADRTYHPAASSDPAKPCPDLLSIPGTDALGFDVPADRFVPSMLPEPEPFVSGYCEHDACERCVQGPEFNLDGKMLAEECTHACHEEKR